MGVLEHPLPLLAVLKCVKFIFFQQWKLSFLKTVCPGISLLYSKWIRDLYLQISLCLMELQIECILWQTKKQSLNSSWGESCLCLQLQLLMNASYFKNDCDTSYPAKSWWDLCGEGKGRGLCREGKGRNGEKRKEGRKLNRYVSNLLSLVFLHFCNNLGENIQFFNL